MGSHHSSGLCCKLTGAPLRAWQGPRVRVYRADSVRAQLDPLLPHASLCSLLFLFSAVRLGWILFLCQDPCCCCCCVASVVSDSVRPQRRQPTRLPHPWDSPGKNTGVGCRFLLQCMKVKGESEVAQSCLTLCDPMDCSLPGFSIHGIFQARVLEWGIIAFSGQLS